MTHWFYVGRDLMWAFLAVLPLTVMSESEINGDGLLPLVGILAQIFWVSAAVNGWFK